MLTPCFIICYICEAFTYWQYCNRLFNVKASRTKQFAVILSLYSIHYAIFTLHILILNDILFIVINFLIIALLYDTSISNAAFHSMLSSVLMIASEYVVMGLFNNIITHFYVHANLSALIAASILSKLLYFVILFGIAHFLSGNKQANMPFNLELHLLILVPSVSVLMILTLTLLTYQADLSRGLQILVSICSFCILALNILVWYLNDCAQRKREETAKLYLLARQQNYYTEYYKSLLSQTKERNLLIHDIKKHLQAIAHYNQEKNSEKIAEYISSLLSMDSLKASIVYCDNHLLNAIINHYVNLCNDKEIDFIIDIRHKTLQNISDSDLTSLMCNLLDNAMSAAVACGNSHIQLKISQKENTSYTMISLENSCNKNPFSANGQLLTAKPDTGFHGFGLEIIKQITKKYGGEISMYHDDADNTFHTNILIPHIVNG